MILGLNEDELFEKGHNACAGCGQALAARHVLKAAGKDVIVVNATGCLEVFSTPYPMSAFKVPWVHAAFENAAAVASGVERYLFAKENRKIKGVSKDKINDKNRSDKSKQTKVLVFAGDGGTYDIGFQALSGAFERKHDLCYVCFDNGAYMNTGVQRSGATPLHANTTTSPIGSKIKGKIQFKKQIPLILAAHGAYVATASAAFPQDLAKKVKKGIAFKGPSFILVDSPCPLGWKMQGSMTVDSAKLAFETNMFPLYEIEEGFFRFSRKPTTKKPIGEYLKIQGRFKGLSERDISEIQKIVDSNFKKMEEFEDSKINFNLTE